ncbi:ImmA/IrrE family metallo-endopeptidase [Ponticaulis koreensis]|uniref:ImmA/IrrE family metallo-endopeptidase n=1 Tax=Ponticaulis koreensis TaxID=1123045 RepID=UPI0003B442A6|nr:ImmA/IrrE family metallo-endopeptidase [Ponticaulis koreensis]
MRVQAHLSASNADKKGIATSAMTAVSNVRQSLGLDQFSPTCIYDICHKIGVTVRFNDINMEGMYQKADKPHIHLSSKRPLSRRAFNCGHELGHHIFGHGSSIDELQEDTSKYGASDPKELLADSFAAHLLMPAIAVRASFNIRGITPDDATPQQLYVIACDFGVGYSTLITHLSSGLGLMSRSRAGEMKRHTPKSIRALLLGEDISTPLIVAGAKRKNPLIDIEVGSLLLLPKDTIVDASKLTPVRRLKNAALYQASSPGIGQVRAPEWSAFARVSRKAYIGLARYRHLEDD